MKKGHRERGRGREEKNTHTRKQVGDGDGWEKRWIRMEMMGVVVSTHELRVGSFGSCVAEECCRGMVIFLNLVPILYIYKRIQTTLLPLVSCHQRSTVIVLSQ